MVEPLSHKKLGNYIAKAVANLYRTVSMYMCVCVFVEEFQHIDVSVCMCILLHQSAADWLVVGYSMLMTYPARQNCTELRPPTARTFLQWPSFKTRDNFDSPPSTPCRQKASKRGDSVGGGMQDSRGII